eukprot:9917486-Lingulodinium_polyedra.AAC.1
MADRRLLAGPLQSCHIHADVAHRQRAPGRPAEQAAVLPSYRRRCELLVPEAVHLLLIDAAQ